MLTGIAALAFTLMGAPGESERTPVVAVFNLQGDASEFKSDEFEYLSEYVSTQVAASGRFKVVPRSEIKRTLAAQKKVSFEACYDESCQIEVGKELAAEKVVVGSIRKFGGLCLVNLRLFDLATSASEGAGTARGACTGLEVLRSLDQAIGQLTGAPASVAAGENRLAEGVADSDAAPDVSPKTVLGESQTAQWKADAVEVDEHHWDVPSSTSGSLLAFARRLGETRHRRQYIRKMAKAEKARCKVVKDIAKSEAKRAEHCDDRPHERRCRSLRRKLAQQQTRFRWAEADRSALLIEARKTEGTAFAHALDLLSRRVAVCWCDPTRSTYRACRVR